MHIDRSAVALLAAPALALTLLLSGCGESSSVADPPVSSGPTSSAPTSDLPHRESPQHFIRRWAEAEKQMENTGKTGPYLAMSNTCTSCKQLASDVQRFFSAGGFVKWGGWQIISIEHYSDRGTRQSFKMKARAAATKYRETGSGPTKHLAGGLSTDLVTIAQDGHAWRVVGFTKLGA